MVEISCDMCMDLIPLVKDEIASNDSKKAVEQHISVCPICKSLYEQEISVQVPVPVEIEKHLHKVIRKIHIFSILLMMFGIFFGLGLTASQEMFYNSLLMPMVGVLGYVIFRWKAIFVVPILIVITNVLSFLIGFMQGAEFIEFYGTLMWAFLYSIFVIIGVIIAGLLHFAFRKEESL